MKWRLSSRGFIYERGEDTAIYFDPFSGNTHLISAFAAHLLRLIAPTPLSETAIIAALADTTTTEDAAELSRVVPGILCQLEELRILIACR